MNVFISTTLMASMVFFASTSKPKAGAETDALAACIADYTTGKDRRDLVRWLFVMVSAHPEIKTLSNVKDEERDAMDKSTAALFERLLTENCKDKTITAMKSEGSEAIKNSFSTLGSLAMNELMTNASVNKAFQKFAIHLNQEKMNSVLQKK